MKLIFRMCILTIVFALSSLVTVASADENTDNPMNGMIGFIIGESNAVVSGETEEIDSTNENVVPFINDGRTFVPVKFISEGFGATAYWNASTQTVTINSGDTVITLSIGSNILYKNGEQIQMDVSPIIEEGRTFLPVKYIADVLGMNSFYDNGLIILSPADREIDATNDASLIENMRDMINNPQNANSNNQNNNQPTNTQSSSSQENYKRCDLTGEITEINGNDISLNIIATPQFTPTDSNSPKKYHPRDAQSSSSQQDTQREPQYTGETKTITIPENTPISTTTRASSGNELQNLQVSDLKIGDILQIWYSNQDSQSLDKISVRQINKNN